MSGVAHMIRSARDPGWLAAGNAVFLLSVRQNLRHEPHQAVLISRYSSAAGNAAPGPGRLPGSPPFCRIRRSRAALKASFARCVVTVRDQGVARLSVLVFTIAACPDQRRAAPPGSPC